MSWPQSGSAGGSTYSPSLQQQQQHSSNPNTSPSAVVGPDFSSLPATSPTHQPNAAAEAAGSGAGRKRKHSESKGPSPEHDGDGAAGQQAQKPHPVKRACNECRQQKVRRNEFVATYRVYASDLYDVYIYIYIYIPLFSARNPGVLISATIYSCGATSPQSQTSSHALDA